MSIFNSMVIKDLEEINRRLSYDLWNVSCFNEKPTGLSPRLIFPQKRKKNDDDESVKRISEQEARILFCNILNNLNYFYSIETPTFKTYQQTGSTDLSALSDLSIYKYVDGTFGKQANIELKAHNPNVDNINKDIEKLIKEGIDGNWVHILKNINSGTLPSVFKKFITSIKNNYKKNDKISILFCICILEKSFSIINYFQWQKGSKGIDEYLEDYFCLEKNNSSNNIEGKKWGIQKDILKNNDWIIVEP
jgi:hypothetical protein